MLITITIIGHREAGHLQELLPGLGWADEVIYVDCESGDGSLEIAEKNGCKTFKCPNNPNLNVNKSYAMEQAQGEWILYLDPDERLPEKLVKELLWIVQDTRHSAFLLNRRNHYFDQWLRYGSQYPDRQLRLFRRGKARFPNRHVHEKLEVEGSIDKLKEDMLHYPYRDIRQFLAKFDFYTDVQAGYLYDSGVRPGFWSGLTFLCLKPWIRFFRRYLLKGGFLDGYAGLFCALFDAMNYIVRYFKLWEKTHSA